MNPLVPDEFPADLLANLEHLGELRSFEAGEVLIHEGDQSNQMYVLVAGKLKVFTDNPRGRELVYNTLSAGDYFGELALDGNPRSASVRALTAGQCVVISGDAVRTLAIANPDFVFQIVMKLIHLLRHSTRKLKSLALDDVYERVLALVEEEALLTDGLRHLPGTLTQQEIAKRIGSSREMVNHVFRDLIRGGFVEKRRRPGLVIRKELPRHW